MVLARCASLWLRWAVQCTPCPLVLLSTITKLLTALVWALAPFSIFHFLECSTTENWRCFCYPHWRSPARCFLGAMGRIGVHLDKPSAPVPALDGASRALWWTVKHNCTLQGRVAGGWGRKHLILIKCMEGIQCFEGSIRLLELKEAIYVPCNFLFEVPQI